MEWIDVNDRLPEDYQKVLFWDNQSIELAVHLKGDFEWMGMFLAKGSVTHWAELPQPPQTTK